MGSDHDTLVEMGFPPEKVLIAHPGDLDEPAGGQALGEQPSGEASGSANDGDGK
ncbi:13430_t:CDS:2 [Rhizophagus irregularis]|nr:13430_t:CDS:2 [Rhizophagus irregularis]